MENRYQTMYNVSLALSVNGKVYYVSPSNIVSIAILYNYDTMTYPIIRFRLFCDLELIQNIVEYPDEIEMVGNLDAGIYLLKDDQSKPSIVSGGTNIPFNMKVYVENKNMPTSVMDQYRDGVKVSSNLNDSPKYTFELFGYHQSLIYYMKRQCQSVYKYMSIESIIQDMLSRGNILNYYMDPLNQNEGFNQVLLPNLSIMQALAFLDTYYGLYEKGAHVYGDLNKLYITNSSSDVAGNIIPIRVGSSNSESDMVGLKKYDNDTYEMCVLFDNVSILSESDIQRVTQAEQITDLNVNGINGSVASLKELYTYKAIDIYGQENIPSILHKYINPFVSSTNAARIKEKITKIDVSAVGFDIGRMFVNTRYNMLFDTSLRSKNIQGLYRPMFVNHVLSNQNDQLFVAQTTMRLCKN